MLRNLFELSAPKGRPGRGEAVAQLSDGIGRLAQGFAHRICRLSVGRLCESQGLCNASRFVPNQALT